MARVPGYIVKGGWAEPTGCCRWAVRGFEAGLGKVAAAVGCAVQGWCDSGRDDCSKGVGSVK